jgi:hypothetical protein
MASESVAQTLPAEIGEVPTDWSVGPLSTFTSRVTYGFTNPMPTTSEGPFMVTAKDLHGGALTIRPLGIRPSMRTETP